MLSIRSHVLMMSIASSMAAFATPNRQVSTPARRLVTGQSDKAFEREIYSLGAQGGSSKVHFFDLSVIQRQQKGSTAETNVFSLATHNDKPPAPLIKVALVNPNGKSFSSRIDNSQLVPIDIDGEYVAAGNTVTVLTLDTPKKGLYRIYSHPRAGDDKGPEDVLFYLSIDSDAERAPKNPKSSAEKKAAIDEMFGVF